MAVDKKGPGDAVTDFDDWYVGRRENERTGALEFRSLAPCAQETWNRFEEFKREHSTRVANYWKYEVMADAEVVSRKPDLPNVSSGDIAGMVRRTARNVVQHTPNVKIICEFDEDSPKGILARHILKTKIIGEELNSNDMQQSLFASTMSAFTLGFDAVCPVLIQRGDKTWVMEYDEIHYRDVFPEPGIKDVTKAPIVFVRRYLTKSEVRQLIRDNVTGWDIPALKALLQHATPPQQRESVAHQNAKHHTIPSGYEIITQYTSDGEPFLTFDANSKMLLRIEKNKDPLKRHPVHFLVLERDPQQPLGKSQISLVFGRQEFQDLMLNGAMKLWYKNINPTLLGYGTGLNGVPNMSPGKYTNIPNPNARIEAFEVNTQTLLQYGTISQQNQGNMINLIGAADQQMAASAGSGMSATPQGVEAQTELVDITTNNYQKAVEHFFSKYCSYALTVYFAEMKGMTKLKPTAETRRALLGAGMPEELFTKDGELDIDMKDMATVYHVKCIPGSLVELEDEKQLRLLNELFVPLSQAMPALAATQDQSALQNASAAMQYIIHKTIELSGSTHSSELAKVFRLGPQAIEGEIEKEQNLEEGIGELVSAIDENETATASVIAQMQEQISTLTAMNAELFEKLGITSGASAAPQDTSEPAPSAIGA